MQDSENQGIINLPSKYAVAETMDRLERVLKSNDIVIFARIDQKEAAEKVELTMRPTELLIFGNPKVGTLLMNSYPSLALDLPYKALAWENEDGDVFLSYNSPEYLKQRHRLKELPFQKIVSLIEKSVE